MPKGTSRPFLNLLRSWGFRGPPDEARFGLAPTMTPVVIAANEPEALPRFYGSAYRVVAGLVTCWELTSPVPLRIREVNANGAVSGQSMIVTGTDLITANAAAALIGSTDGRPSRSAARTGTVGAVFPAAIPYWVLSIDAALQGAHYGHQQDPWMLPPGRRLYIVANLPNNAVYCSAAWEELGD